MLSNNLECRPLYFKRYVDDTIAFFNDISHGNRFLSHINSLHPNIKFTIEQEVNNFLPFLDIRITRDNNNFTTSVYRKDTFSGMGQNFYSSTDNKFKLNTCRTLLFRAYEICSNWSLFHKEIEFLSKFFIQNSFPTNVFPKIVNKFLDHKFNPKIKISTAPKKIVYLALPFMGLLNKQIKTELNSNLSRLFPMAEFKICFINNFKIGNLFRFKDTLPKLMRSRVVYKYNCPKCNLGTYVGSTDRLLKIRIDSHRGVSYRTGNPLNTLEPSPIRSHNSNCNSNIVYDNFSILSTANSQQDLLILESLFIKSHSPLLNNNVSCIPLSIA